MKKIILLILLLFPIIAQAQKKDPIFNKNCNWIEVRTNLFYPEVFELSTYKISGDTTLLNGENYSKLFRNDTLFAGLRETEDNKIYAVFPGLYDLFTDKELLIYDFDWYPGKELYYNNTWEEELILLTVLEKSIDSIQLLDEKYYQCLKDDFGEAWLIRGIGDTGGFFCGIFPVPLDGSQFALLCFYIDDILVYSNPNFNYCETVSIAEIEQNLEINIYPNPTTGELKIDASNSLSAGNEELIIENIEIFDITGKEKKFFIKSSASMSNIVIDISHLPAGIYYLRLNKTITKIIKL